MPVHNTDIAEVFSHYADLLEINDANPYRVRAYRSAAQTINGLPRSAADMLKSGKDLSELPNIGKDLAGKIEEIIETGKLADLEEAEEQLPAELTEIMELPGVGAKRVRQLHDELDINSPDDLQQAIEDHQVRELEGFGKKTEEKMLDALRKRKERGKRTRLATVVEIADALLEYIRDVKGVKDATVAGSYRRQKETVGDLDILVTCKRDSPVMDRFVEYDEVDEVVSKGKSKSTVILRRGLQVDLRKIAQVSYGAALHYFTGSKAHNIALRKMAVKEDLKLNEYGLFRGEERIAGKTEEEIFNHFDLPYIEPELRENRGEIEAAQKGELPDLITLDDIRGDLHSHTKATDGHYTLAQMAEAAQELGYDYLAITDHSPAVAMANGLNEERLREQMEEIDKLNEEFDGFRLLKSCEVDILEDGSLDLPDDVLKELDLVVCSIHSHFNLSQKNQTDRVCKAMENPNFHILGHPTGRLINSRDPYDIDVERVMRHALDSGCFLELNAQPSRLDLSDTHCKMAKEMGLKISISTDSHHTASLEFMRFGIGQARRGWIEADDVLNTRSWTELQKLLKR